MKLKKAFSSIMLLVFFTATPVLANNSPGPQILLSEILVLPVMIILSIIGGAYTVIERLRGKKSRVFPFVLAIIIIFFSFADEGLCALVGIIFGVIALQRSIKMITWGFHARSNREDKEHLMDVTPWRLISAGIVLIPVTIFFIGQAIAFVGYWPMIGQKDREAGLKDFVTYKLAYARWEKTNTGKTFFHAVQEDDKKYNYKGFSPSSSYVQIEYSEDGKHFTVYMLPHGHFPFFPYNYFTSQPSYRVDETGQIRMVMVNKRDKKCPTDAPIVMKVSEFGIKNKLQEIEKHKQAEKTLSEI